MPSLKLGRKREGEESHGKVERGAYAKRERKRAVEEAVAEYCSVSENPATPVAAEEESLCDG